jgi:hypothetical protein
VPGLEERVAKALKGFAVAPPGAPYDLQNVDGTRVLELKTRLQGIRDIDAELLRLSKILADSTGVKQACLLATLPRVTDDRLRTEWTSLERVLKPGIMRRLALIAIGRERPWISREEPTLRRIADAANAAVLSMPHESSEERPPQPTRTFFEVFKVLLNGWLLGKEPASSRELIERTGFSYPTIADSVRRLEGTGEMDGGRKRGVAFRGFPRQTWSQLLALSRSVRGTRAFIDGAGHRPDPPATLRRLRGHLGKGFALGGVVAARYWDPRFDLNGLPRLDLCLTRTSDVPLRKLGLVPAGDASPERVLLVTHVVERRDPLFQPDPKGGIPYADPVETLLDLHELRLVDQAEALIKRLRAMPT